MIDYIEQFLTRIVKDYRTEVEADFSELRIAVSGPDGTAFPEASDTSAEARKTDKKSAGETELREIVRETSREMLREAERGSETAKEGEASEWDTSKAEAERFERSGEAELGTAIRQALSGNAQKSLRRLMVRQADSDSHLTVTVAGARGGADFRYEQAAEAQAPEWGRGGLRRGAFNLMQVSDFFERDSRRYDSGFEIF